MMEPYENNLNNEILNNLENEETNALELKNEEQEIINYDEEVLEETLAKDFSYQIRERGEDYYYDENIERVYKTKNKYIAKVIGSKDEPYDVEITVTDEENANYKCTCPCTYPCKHEYAVLMAISNKEYSEVELKTIVKEKETNLKSIIEQIPAEELKEYLLLPKGLDNVIVETNSFKNHFRKYYPKQKYEFYYNNLYNELVTNGDYIKKIDSYIDRAKQYLLTDEFDESFKIVKSIIEAYSDSNKLNFDDYVFDVINKLGMILRITYRKAQTQTKQEIENWSNNLETKMYYNNYYLEDLILNLK